MRSRSGGIPASALILWAAALQCQAQLATCQVRKVPTNPRAGELWGWAVAANGGRVLIGAPGVNSNYGAAFLFDAAPLNPVVILRPSGAGQENNSGAGLALSDDGLRALVGAPSDLMEEGVDGSVFVFENNAVGFWEQTSRLNADQPDPNPPRNEYFGRAISNDGDRITIGAYLDNAAYVFDLNADGSWSQVARLTGEPATGWLGYSVALRGDTAVAGAPYDFTQGFYSGAVFVFQRQADGNWMQVQRLLPSPGNFLGFGRSVGISANTILVGSPTDSTRAPNAGAVYVFQPDAEGLWSEQQRLYAPHPENSDVFGTSIAIDGDRAVIGAENYSGPGTALHPGAAFMYERGPDGLWALAGTLRADDPHDGSRFGNSVALCGNVAVVGAPYQTELDADGDPISLAGAAYVFVAGPGSDRICECRARGDLDLDGQVGMNDLIVLLSSFGIGTAGDINHDGDTDLQDLANLLSNWAVRCP